ncbi:MAG: hypothetical protein II961_08795 [Candidatus Riflebacteria bacterium]|nr:hypothetical protein [Candidatus Riflebacteria bacterium]
MKNLFRSSCLVVALIASVAMVGCGGGGGGSSHNNNGGNTQTLSEEATAVRDSITPVMNYAGSIISGGVNGSPRLSTSNTNTFNTKEINDATVASLKTPNYLRAVIAAAGGNIEGGLWENESTTYSFSEVATYSNGIYERTVYCDNLDDIIKYGENSYGGSLEDSVMAYYKIEGCVADYDKENNIIRSLKINKDAKITVNEKRGFFFRNPYKHYAFPTSFKGTINTDLTVKWEGNTETFESPKVFELSEYYFYPTTTGKNITANFKTYNEGIQTSKKITSKTTYTFSKLEMNLTEVSVQNVGSNYYYDQEFQGNLKININGISGNITANKTIFVDSRVIQSNGKAWIFDNEKSTYYSDNAYDYDEETGEEILVDTSKPYHDYYNVVIVKKPVMDLKYASPVTIALSGDVSNYIFGIDGWHPEKQPIDYQNKVKKYNGEIKNLTLKINKMSGKFDNTLAISNAEVHVETGEYQTDEIFMIGDYEVAFSKAKIDITGFNYNYAWEEDESLTEKEFNQKCFGNTIVHFEGEESKNSVSIKADCNLSKKTATVNLVNNGNLVVKDKSNKEKVTEFNFKTVDIDATNVDIIADNKCEGALLTVKGVEKDNTITERTYKVVNGKLVRTDLPKVDINVPDEIKESNYESLDATFTKAKEEDKKEIANNSSEELKVVASGNKKIASYNKKDNSIKTKIVALNDIINAISFYSKGSKKFTVVFAINNVKKSINGYIYEGERKDVSINVDSGSIAQFAGENSNVTVVPNKGKASTFKIK